MRKADQRRLNAVRGGLSDLENHYVDELLAGRLNRREFLRRGAVIGLSASAMGAVLAACGSSSGSSSAASTSGAAPKGGTLKLASQTPATAMNPLLVDDGGGICMLSQVGEYLALDNSLREQLEPMLATSWSPSQAGAVWTFKLRRGVTFHNGQAMTADDVVYTFQQLSDPKNASNALSTFAGVLKPEGVIKVDSSTVAFHLESPNGNFPYLVSSDNYNAIIVPKGTDFGKWGETMIATGPFKMHSYTVNQGATFVANKSYWGGPPNLDSTAFTFYASQEPQLLALQGGTVDVVVQFAPFNAQAILSNPQQYSIIRLRTSGHRELSMRCDQEPFKDPRVRQAIAYSLNRPEMVNALLEGYGVVANDNPFAPIFKSSDLNVPQRTQNIAKAKQLLEAAGHPHFSTVLDTEQYQEIPQLAQVIQASARKIGVDITLNVMTQAAYYGKETYGNSPWLDAPMSLVDYGGRGVPNVYLEATLTTGGPWNAAHFSDPEYDRLVKQYVAAVDLHVQRQLAGKIEMLLLEQTPVVIPYFIDFPSASTPKVGGLLPTPMSQMFLKNAYIQA
jgi:peptide/nickel transport system substrate-binding protein